MPLCILFFAAVLRGSDGLALPLLKFVPDSSDSDGLPDNLCDSGKLLPQIFLLGAQKAATSTLATDLASGGIINTALGGAKETHFFDTWLPSNETYNPVNEKDAWLEMLPRCFKPGWEDRGGRRIAADFTPSNLRSVPLPHGTTPSGSHWGMWFLSRPPSAMNHGSGLGMNLPLLLKSFYGESLSKRPTFIVMLREPLARMQSAWYHAATSNPRWMQCRDCKARTFEEALQKTMDRARASPARYDDWLWASLYARQLEHWTQAFDPRQMYFIPYSYYAGGDRATICQEISVRLGGNYIDCTKISDATNKKENTHAHPRLEDDCSEALRDESYKFFSAENDRLLRLLGTAQLAGAGLANSRDVSKANVDSVDSLRPWLENGW